MGRLSKVVLFSLLLILAGVQGTASPLCAQPMQSRAHACCRSHQHVNASHCGATSAAVSATPACCKVAPIESTPFQPLVLPGGSQDSAYGLHAISDIAGVLPAPFLFSGRGSSRLAKLQHSPVHALLCTFLV